MKKFLCMLLTAVLAGCMNDSPEEPVPEICPVEEYATSGYNTNFQMLVPTKP